jgi:hypothetical protein
LIKCRFCLHRTETYGSAFLTKRRWRKIPALNKPSELFLNIPSANSEAIEILGLAKTNFIHIIK